MKALSKKKKHESKKKNKGKKVFVIQSEDMQTTILPIF